MEAQQETPVPTLAPVEHKAQDPNPIAGLELALKSRLPVIWVRSDDIINVEEVLSFIADTPVEHMAMPEVIKKADELVWPKADVVYTSDNTKSIAKLYRAAVDKEKTVVFINTEKNKTQFDGGVMIPPMALVEQYLEEMGAENVEELLPTFGGLTLKDVGEVAKMTMTRDGSLTPKGVNTTRKGYTKLQGITQVETEQAYYACPEELAKWMSYNKDFFVNPKHPSLTPRGLLFDGPPGTGKTEASKAIASEFGVPLYRLDLGTMMGKYVGESEGNLNAALQQIDEVAPCVVIFDEVEKGVRSSGDSSGVSSRMLSQLLWWLQEHKTRVFTVMTTNDLSAIPVELYREGRIDKTMKFLGIANPQEGYSFAVGAFNTMLKELEAEASPAQMDELQKRVKSMFVDGQAVPQVKLVNMVNSLIREMLAPKPADDAPAEDAPAPVKKAPVMLKLAKKPAA